MPCDIGHFGLTEMLRTGQQVRQLGTGATMEEAAQRLCRFFYDKFIEEGTGTRQCALVRFYKTHPYALLEGPLKLFAARAIDDVTPHADMKCLTLLGTVGDEPPWNSRRLSRAHQAIPLASPNLAERAPMIAQLIRQFGLDTTAVLDSSPETLSDLLGKTYGVFHAEDAAGSPYVAAQDDFVRPYGIRSAISFGGSLRSGDLYAIILFSRAAVPRDAADRFRNVALDVKSILFDLDIESTFTPPVAAV